VYLREMGCDVVGLDFATRTLQETKSQRSELPLVGGDLSRLPFADRVFGCVISLGALSISRPGRCQPCMNTGEC
jgi:ubiquinone/menaquinone biosynthesis C-methylase UbiE